MDEKNEHAKALGSIKTAKKTAASRTTITQARAARKPPAPCTCGRDDGSHAIGCAGYARYAQARYRERKKAAEQGNA